MSDSLVAPPASKLKTQDLSKLNVHTLTPLSPEVISRQATINIGTIGHVAHGKSTVVKAVSGVQTVRFKNELERNITIKLGYANAKIYKCSSAKCPRPACYRSYGSNKEDNPPCEVCGSRMNLLRHVSFVDCLTEEHQLLTNRGFMFLRDIEALPSSERDNLLFAGYDHETGHMLYEPPHKLIVKPSAQQKMIEVTDQQHISFVVTPGHDLFVQHGRRSTHEDNGSITWDTKLCPHPKNPSRLQRVTIDFAKQKASSLVHPQPDSHDVVKLLAHAPQGLRLVSGDNADLATVLAQLNIPASCSAEFLQLYGYWLGVGSMRADAAEFSLPAHPWLVGAMRKLHLDAYVSSTADGFTVHSALWLSVFAPTDIKTVASWAWSLDKEGVRAIFHGLRLGSDNETSIVVATESLRDDLLRLALHGGFAAFFERATDADAGWKVSWSRRSRHTTPVLHQKRDVHEISYHGRTWCVSMPHGFIIARRAWNAGASQSVIMGNCPGHDILMATMLNGAAVMDAAFLLIAGNESCPQPQTSEHLAAIEIMKLKHIIILQNKIDLIKDTAAQEQYQQILSFVKGTVADGAPVVPISAQLRYNVDTICEYIVKRIPVPMRDFTTKPRLIVIRSFDVNKPGSEVDTLKGGVAGGSILHGVLKVGDEIEVRPGIVSKDTEGKVRCRPIFSRIVSLYAEQNDLQFAVPGGLIGVGTKIDPTLCRADRLVGQVLGAVGELPPIFSDIEVNYFLLRRLLGVKTEDKKQSKVQKLTKGEVLMVNIGSTSTGGKIVNIKNDLAKIALTSPACTEVGEKIALSRRIEKHWRLIGWGQILKGTTIEVQDR